MNHPDSTADTGAEQRASLSQGSSAAGIIAWAGELIRAEISGREATVLDVGCGQGALARQLAATPARYLGLDLIRYEGFSQLPTAQFLGLDLNATPYPLPAGHADVVATLETIEHLENPRAFLRELGRLARPGGLILVSTPNQLSWLSKLSLIFKDEFTAFQEAPGLYPTHITALLASDLLRMARENGWVAPEIRFSRRGRIPGCASCYPDAVARRFPRRCSDNIMLLARTAAGGRNS